MVNTLSVPSYSVSKTSLSICCHQVVMQIFLSLESYYILFSTVDRNHTIDVSEYTGLFFLKAA